MEKVPEHSKQYKKGERKRETGTSSKINLEAEDIVRHSAQAEIQTQKFNLEDNSRRQPPLRSRRPHILQDSGIRKRKLQNEKASRRKVKSTTNLETSSSFSHSVVYIMSLVEISSCDKFIICNFFICLE